MTAPALQGFGSCHRAPPSGQGLTGASSSDKLRDVDRVDPDSASEHISRLGAEISDVLLGSMTGPFAHVIVDLTGGKDNVCCWLA